MAHTAYLLRYSYHTIPYHALPYHFIPHHNSLCLALLCIASHRLVSFSLVWFGLLFFATRPSLSFPLLPFPFLPSSSLFYRILAQTASSSSSKHSVAYCNDLAQLIDWLTDSPTDRPTGLQGMTWWSPVQHWPDLTYLTVVCCTALLDCTTSYRTWCDLTLPDLTYTDLTWIDLTWPVLEWRDLYWV